MTETTTKASEKPTKNHPTAPMKLYQKIFCKHCPDNEYCRTSPQRMQLCTLTLIADELARTRQLQQQKTQHQSW